MKILALVTDAFGGYGGIALYNRDFLTALCSYPHLDKAVAIPRIMPLTINSIPSNLAYVTDGLNSKYKYLRAILNTVNKNSNFDMLICGHINLLPIAYFLRIWLKVPIILLIFGIEAWEKTKSPLLNYLANKVDNFISISEFTKNRFMSWISNDNLKGFVLPNAIHTNIYGIKKKTRS